MATNRKTLQEKKALSYALDRRNCYGENHKAARKAIPARKAAENRRSRRKSNQALERYEQLDEVNANLVEGAIVNDLERLGGWKKCPDRELGKMVVEKIERRGLRSGRRVKRAEES